MSHKLITFERIVKSGATNFIRNFSLSIAAMAVMIVTLTIILFSLIANSTFSHTIYQITSKIDISVYLKDSVTTNQKNQLLANLKALPNVASVQYLDKQQALESFKSNPSNANLEQAIIESGNPLPATVLIKPRNLNNIQSIKNYLSQPNVASLQSDQPSYSGARKAAIDKISHATDVLREIGIIAVVVFAIISALIIFNTIQMAIFNRREELQIMRLLGATTWYIRGPFVVESVIYGVISALISVGFIEALFVTARTSLQASSLGLLDIGYAEHYFDGHLPELLILQIVLGILIGAASSVIATRRYLKFKTSK